MVWKVQLSGPQYELDELLHSFGDGDFSLSRGEHGEYYLYSSQFDGCNSANDVREVSTAILKVLNGATKLALGGNLGLTVSCVVEQRPDGIECSHMCIVDTVLIKDSFVIRIFDSKGNFVNEYSPADFVPIWLKLGLQDDVVGKVFRLFGQQHDWVNLYRIYEVIEEDVNGIVKKGWLTEEQKKVFKHTANSPTAIGDEARHGKEPTSPPRFPMLLSEARVLIENLVHKWLRTKSTY